MNDQESLYQDAIKQFARAAHGQGHLPAATGEAKLANPLCGDRVRMQVEVAGGRIAAVAHETKGCLLCRASAALVGLRAAGYDAGGMASVVHDLEGMLHDGTPAPPAWPELAMFEPARGYPSRHGCVLLPFKALLAAMAESESKRAN